MKPLFRMIWTAVAFCLLFRCTLADGRRPAAAKVEELYSEAWTLRSRLGANASDYKLAASMLLEAAGLTIRDIKEPESIPHNFTGHRGALRELAKALERGQGVPCNLPLSLRLFRRAAELGDPEAHGEMGTRFSYGLQDESSATTNQLIGFSMSDLPQALLHFSFGAFGNDTASQMALGYRHMSGQGVPQNCRTAVSYYNAAAERVIELGRMPGTLPYVEKVRLSARSLHGLRSAKEQQWLQFYQYSADMGDVDAQAALGQLFNYGAHGLERDHQQALHYFRQAADAGDAGAMSHLGHMYANGFGVEKDNSTALKWFKSAAAKNHPNGHYGLGYMYLAGYGVKKDLKIAAEHFRKDMEPESEDGCRGRNSEVMDIDAVGDFFQDLFGVYDKDEVGELVETLVLGVLVVVFMVVFRRRHQTRGNPQVGALCTEAGVSCPSVLSMSTCTVKNAAQAAREVRLSASLLETLPYQDVVMELVRPLEPPELIRQVVNHKQVLWKGHQHNRAAPHRVWNNRQWMAQALKVHLGSPPPHRCLCHTQRIMQPRARNLNLPLGLRRCLLPGNMVGYARFTAQCPAFM
ncbi:unnamed protein product [Ostreobium quekettii]|uniref:Uncharacterized protein n=1 Tax=Ostreobium quekettii TaxID=121088 RepID=A0A8S1IRF1_9CHLO|nr:unnamed protein product [Ostreobium quekettii]